MNRRGFLRLLPAAPAAVAAGIAAFAAAPAVAAPVVEAVEADFILPPLLTAARINKFKGQILRHAVPRELLGHGPTLKAGHVVKRWLPYAPDGGDAEAT